MGRCLLRTMVIAPIVVLQGEKSSRFGVDKGIASSGRNRPTRGVGASKGLLKVFLLLPFFFFVPVRVVPSARGL